MSQNRGLIRRIMISINKIDELYEIILRKAGTKANTVWVLYALDDGKPHSQKQIYEEWLIPKTTINTVVKELVNHGYITMQAIPGKRREMNLCLTESGKKFARNILDHLYNLEETAFQQIKNVDLFINDLELFCNYLNKTFKNMNIEF